jgi:thiamine pyrophosphate-dependent acetolactate synthase large subunit-like protein
MKRQEIIKTIIGEITSDIAVVSSTGLISRELFGLKDAPNHFYMTGSMGLVSSIGLGVALNKPAKKVLVIDGDGSLMMNLGTLVTIGCLKPSNLIHVVLDNGAYDSCSGEPSFSSKVALEELAQKTGYALTKRITSESELKDALRQAVNSKDGPLFLLVKFEPGGDRHLPRPMDLPKVGQRFKEFLSTN